MAHITGGGITDNLPRVCRRAPPRGSIARRGACRRSSGGSAKPAACPSTTCAAPLNMGIGMILVVAATDADAVRKGLLKAGEANSVVIGEIIRVSRSVQYA